MRDILNQKMRHLTQGGIRYYAGKVTDYEDAITLCIGEPDFTTPDDIMEAAASAMRAGHTHYTLNAGLEELRYEIAGYVKKYGIQADYQTEILVTCGAMGSLMQVCMALLDDGDEVILANPYWLNHASQISLAGGVPVFVDVSEADEFVMKADKLAEKITPRTKAVLLNTPSNPTGAVISKEELEAIAEVAKKEDLFVISDEIYSELMYDGTVIPSIASLPGMKERTIVINGFSKAFAMTGWRLGYTIAPKEMIEKMIVLQENVNSCASSISQYAGIYALQSMSGVEQMVQTYKKRRQIVADGFNGIEGISCIMPKGAFYAFPNISSFGKTSKEFAEELMEHTHVLTVPGSCFGSGGEGFLRISYASSEEELYEAISRIKKYIEG